MYDGGFNSIFNLSASQNGKDKMPLCGFISPVHIFIHSQLFKDISLSNIDLFITLMSFCKKENPILVNAWILF